MYLYHMYSTTQYTVIVYRYTVRVYTESTVRAYIAVPKIGTWVIYLPVLNGTNEENNAKSHLLS